MSPSELVSMKIVSFIISCEVCQSRTPVNEIVSERAVCVERAVCANKVVDGQMASTEVLQDLEH